MCCCFLKKKKVSNYEFTFGTRIAAFMFAP